MVDKLKPCPFCGHKAVVEDCGDNSYFVRCSHCSINQDKLYAQKCDAVKAWNRRAEPTQEETIEEIGRFFDCTIDWLKQEITERGNE